MSDAAISIARSGGRAEVASSPLDPSSTQVHLSVQADRSTYAFHFDASESTLRKLTNGETRYLSTEAAG